MSKTLKNLLSALSILLSMNAFADVSLRNGNFFVSYVDVEYPGGFDPKIERVYNSKSPFNGIFGWGWANELDVKLTVSADGSVVIHEYGGGAQNRFNPSNFNSAELDKAVEMIVNASRSSGVIGGAGQLSAYRQKLKSDAIFRNEEWQKHRNAGRLKARALKEGTRLTSNRFAYQYVTVSREGYTRTMDNGKTEFFDSSGRLYRVQDKNGNFFNLGYGRDGRVEKLQDNFNRKMFFSYNERGKLVKIQGESGKFAEYRYNDRDELIQSRDTDGNAYTFKYSSDNRHNLIEIGFNDKTSMRIAYYGRDLLENVKSVKDRDGTVTEYAYGKVRGEGNSHTVAVKIKTQDGAVVSDSAYEYVFRTKATGEEWTYRMVSTLDGLKTETTYNECCGLPLVIRRAGEETSFAYDTQGRVTRKTTPTEVTQLTYDPKAGKVAKVELFPKGPRSRKPEWSQFQYDSRGNLVLAKNSAGQGVRLFYDKAGRIQSMVDQRKQRLDFKYNENSKPVEIIDPSIGSIQVSYTNSGEVKSVDSRGGRQIASQVTSAFQNLLEIIKPAGVSLTF